MSAQTKKICSGEYKRISGANSVTLSRIDELDGWIAVADWDQTIYTDPMPTKRRAVFVADLMLQNV